MKFFAGMALPPNKDAPQTARIIVCGSLEKFCSSGVAQHDHAERSSCVNEQMWNIHQKVGESEPIKISLTNKLGYSRVAAVEQTDGEHMWGSIESNICIFYIPHSPGVIAPEYQGIGLIIALPTLILPALKRAWDIEFLMSAISRLQMEALSQPPTSPRTHPILKSMQIHSKSQKAPSVPLTPSMSVSPLGIPCSVTVKQFRNSRRATGELWLTRNYHSDQSRGRRLSWSKSTESEVVFSPGENKTSQGFFLPS